MTVCRCQLLHHALRPLRVPVARPIESSKPNDSNMMRDLCVSPSATVLLFAASIALSAFTVLAQTNKTLSIPAKGMLLNTFRFYLNCCSLFSAPDYVTLINAIQEVFRRVLSKLRRPSKGWKLMSPV